VPKGETPKQTKFKLYAQHSHPFYSNMNTTRGGRTLVSQQHAISWSNPSRVY
jgi:hypothetical protein